MGFAMFEDLVAPILDRPVTLHIGVLAVNRKQIEGAKLHFKCRA